MKRYLNILLVVLLFLPIVTVFIFDAKYSGLQTSLCTSNISNDVSLKYACTYPERNERERLVTTAFYRHVADYFGREKGTSPSLLDEAAFTSSNGYVIEKQIGDFNRHFAVIMLLSIIVSSISATLLVQKLHNVTKARRPSASTEKTKKT